MTELLYLKNCYLKEFDATVVESGEDWVVLDKTAFYPEGGGQEYDLGIIEWDNTHTEVIEVRKRDGKVVHTVLFTIPAGTKIKGKIDWDRRYKEMRMHTSQHLLSSIILDMYGAETAGNQIHTDRTRVDFSMPELAEEMMKSVAEKFNELVDKSIPVSIYTLPRDEVPKHIAKERLRLFARIPESVKDVRIIDISEVDQCPCGGTHISNTKEIGHIVDVEIVRKGSDRQRMVYSLESL